MKLSVLLRKNRRVHVVPVNDIVEHDEYKDRCVCGPSVEVIRNGKYHMTWWIISHSSLDGRELTE